MKLLLEDLVLLPISGDAWYTRLIAKNPEYATIVDRETYVRRYCQMLTDAADNSISDAEIQTAMTTNVPEVSLSTDAPGHSKS